MLVGKAWPLCGFAEFEAIVFVVPLHDLDLTALVNHHILADTGHEGHLPVQCDNRVEALFAGRRALNHTSRSKNMTPLPFDELSSLKTT